MGLFSNFQYDQVIIPSHLLVENYVIPAIHPTRNHSALILRNHILRHLLWKWVACKLFLFPKKEILDDFSF